MTTIPTNVNGTASNVTADGTYNASSNSLTGKNQFLTLLVNELRNQDPTAPTDEKQTLSQLAQFSSLEEMQNLNQTLSASSGYSQISQSAALIGKTVSTATDTAAGVSGVVSSVSFAGGKTYLSLGTPSSGAQSSGAQSIDASTITSITQ